MRLPIAIFFATSLLIVSQVSWAQRTEKKTPSAVVSPTTSAFVAVAAPSSVQPSPSPVPAPALPAGNDPNVTFVEQCLTQTTLIDKLFRCEVALEDGVSVLSFSLQKGRAITVRGSGQFGSFSKDFKVQRITHLHPRITGNGAVDESIRFYSENALNTNRATMTIPCHQEDVAYVGFAKVGDLGLPEEMVAACALR